MISIGRRVIIQNPLQSSFFLYKFVNDLQSCRSKVKATFCNPGTSKLILRAHDFSKFWIWPNDVSLNIFTIFVSFNYFLNLLAVIKNFLKPCARTQILILNVPGSQKVTLTFDLRLWRSEQNDKFRGFYILTLRPIQPEL